MNDGTQSQATAPGCGQVGDADILVAFSLLLAPGEEFVRPDVRLCRGRRDRSWQSALGEIWAGS